ncbi:MAG: hypothetical protein H6727_02565 [Myxococcales bacterium]|nr:hypothetical protein [Myxococcales bacterium]
MPPPLRYPSLHPPPLIQSHKPRYIVLFTLIATLFFAQTALTACPEPSSQTDGATEQTEPSLEKVEVPEEATNPEESVQPEEGGPIEQEPTKENGPEPELERKPDTVEPYISGLNGTGKQEEVNAAGAPFKPNGLPSMPTKTSPNRIQDAIVITGGNLDQIERWELQPKDGRNQKQTWENQQIMRDSDMKHTLSLTARNLVAGAFLLVGFTANTQQAVSADVFILQGEKGDKGEIGDNKLTDTEAGALKALLTKLKANANDLEITADSIKVAPATANGKVTLDLSASAVIKAGNNTLDFTGDTITVTTKTFEAKGTNGTSIKLDDTAHNITLSAKQKNSTTNTATFSLDGGDANMTNTVLPSATFNRMNVHIENGDGKTDSMNKLGNLIIGYNAPRSNPPTGYNRDGSHYLVIGDNHGYTSYGGIVVGYQHLVTAQYASVSGGEGNSATAQYASVSGGEGNSATAQYASISGGSGNTASAPYASVSGGQGNQAVSDYASVSGGKSGTAGVSNNKSGTSHAYVCGGNGKNAITQHSIACDGP